MRLNQNDSYRIETKESFLKEFKESDADEKEDFRMELQKFKSLDTLKNQLRGTRTASELNKRTMKKMKVYDSDNNSAGRRTSSSEGNFKSSDDNQSGDDSIGDEDFMSNKQTDLCSCFGLIKRSKKME